MRGVFAIATFGLLLLAPWSAEAQLDKNAQKEAKAMVEGRHYLRIDLPCWYVAGGFGIGVEPVVEVSPTAVDYERLGKAPAQATRATSKFWGLGPNDSVQYGTLQFKPDAIIAWLEGVAPKNQEVMVRFVQIKTLDEFKTAFARVFSKVPLQDEHPEWSAEVRQAIAKRIVIKGMTVQQAACVIGKPMAVSPTTENGVAGEVWVPRQENGTMLARMKIKSTLTGFPTMLKFVGGILQEIMGGEPPK